MTRAHLTAQLDAAAVRQTHIKHCDIGRCSRNPIESFLDSASFSDHLEVIFGLEHVADAAPDHFVVVNEEDTQRHREILPHRDLGGLWSTQA